MELRMLPRIVEVGRMFPTLVRKLRHGPLCEAAGGGGWTLDDEGVPAGLESRVVESRVSRQARRGLGLLGMVAASKQVCDEGGRYQQPRPRPRSSARPGESVF